MLLESPDRLLRALSPSGRPLTSSGKIFITGSDATRRHGAVESARAETAVAGQENTRIRTGHAIEVRSPRSAATPLPCNTCNGPRLFLSVNTCRNGTHPVFILPAPPEIRTRSTRWVSASGLPYPSWAANE